MEDLLNKHWDVVVIGTGMGGATLGHALAAQGRELLFIERGRDLLDAGAPAAAPMAGGTAAARASAQAQTAADRLALGMWPTPIRGSTNRGSIDHYPSLGCGTGGSTLLYAAQLERLFPADFQPRANFADSAEGSTLPTAWPIRYDELLPHYEEAERLYRVCGTADPLAVGAASTLRAPPPLSARDRHFMDSFRQLGLKAYQAHVACDFVEGCVGCGGTICVAGCKGDARRACLAPALMHHGARLLADCEVLTLDADVDRVRGVRVRWRGEEYRIGAALVILAAGALMSPRILLQSRSAA